MKRSLGYIKATQGALWTLTALAISLLLYQSSRDPQTINVFSTVVAGMKTGIGIRVDILSTLLFVMVTSLGATIGHYADRYLDGESRQNYFYKYLTGVIFSASLLVLSSNLLMFFGMWLAISYSLHKLLVYYNERPQALMAARKKAIVSRIGDVALLLAIVLTYRTFGTFEFADIFLRVEQFSVNPGQWTILSWIGILIVTGALTKSAQFPFHFWLPDTMETPTPVSALMHAGVINAGGFLIIRLSPLLQHELTAHVTLTLVGSVSAVFGALCMIVQNDIKKKLAYSTISQMGMMMVACGLGAYGIAMFHIFAHSFYKAYAFLSTGKLVEESKKIGLKIRPLSYQKMSIYAVSGFAMIFLGGQIDGGRFLPTVTYVSILLLGLFQNSNTFGALRASRFQVFSQVSFVLLCATGICGVIEYFLGQQVSLFTPQAFGSQYELYLMITLSLAVFSIFLIPVVLGSRLMNINTPFLEKTYVYLRNGGYLGLRSSLLLSGIYPSAHVNS